VGRRYSWAAVVSYVVESALSGDEDAMGFTLGWLSALAVGDRVMALRAVKMLEMLVRWMRRCPNGKP